MYITYDVMYDVTVWYHNYAISYPKNCDITCEIIGNKKIHHMWKYSDIIFIFPHHTMISYVISHAWYHIIAYDIICDIICEISHAISHMISQLLWYHMWYHILVSSRPAAVAISSYSLEAFLDSCLRLHLVELLHSVQIAILAAVKTAEIWSVERKWTMKRVYAQKLSKTELEFQLKSQLVFQPIESEVGR